MTHLGFEIRLLLLTVTMAGLPIAYLRLCRSMRENVLPHPPRVAFFFLFGTVGGWVLAFMLSPSGLAARCILLMVTVSPITLLISSVYLASRPERSFLHRLAMWSGVGYCALLALGAVTIKLMH